MYPNEMATRLSNLRMWDYSALPVQNATLEDFDLLEVERLRRVTIQNTELKNHEICSNAHSNTRSTRWDVHWI